ncbi:glycoside hydrolase family 66 protein [Gryllotalpicola daejeonensis]|uniref:Glycoside hydrolase family 66 protein n=1 Tax=Gryllotalpicola daejeonensis TaxID=993087 RepID=A0ABP7ZKX4_9MICO
MELNDDITLIPSAASYRPGQRIEIELAGEASGQSTQRTLVVTHLLEEVARVEVDSGTTRIEVSVHELGGYGVALVEDNTIVARTAFDVLDSPFERPRYGFTAKLDAETDAASVVAFFRRMHLNLAQFYDWGYRHSELLPPEREYLDPLGQPRDLEVVNGLAAAFDEAGVLPLGYSAVYAVGNSETDAWKGELLLRADGVPYRLGEEFLTLLDPAAPRWLEHYGAMLARALAGTALRGFHLDQYGWPKRALRGDGVIVDLDRSYATMIEAVRAAVPDAGLIFNNVNDFGTVQTAGTPQDASYIEVWPPHDTLGDLGLLATRTRALRPEHPPILSAYLSCYATESAERADAAAELVMATAFSHGASHLLLGEAGHALTDPYYPKNHTLPLTSHGLFARWYDAAVRWGDLLFDPAQQDVSEFMTGGINNDVVLDAEGVRFSTKAEPGTVWTRVVRTSRGLVIHLINLLGQSECAWDAGKSPATALDGATLTLAPVTGREAPVWIEPGADPLALAGAVGADDEAHDALSASQTTLEFPLPPLATWGFVFVPFTD